MSTPNENPPFPILTLSTWNRNGGELRGEGVLPAWATLQTKASPNLVMDPGDGTFSLTVNTPAASPKSPSTEQIAAYEYLQKSDMEIVIAILESIFDEYAWMQDEYAEYLSPDEATRLAPVISTPQELLPLLSLVTIVLHPIHKDGLAYIGMSFECSWDKEHGIGVLIHRSKVVSVGQWDTAFMEWILEADMQGDNPT